MNTVGSDGNLAQGFKPRHVTMLSIAGIIGAGLFVGSGHAIAAAGPATIISYFVAGTLVVLVMRMLGEMAVAHPDTGSFSTYADQAIGRWAGYTIGWLYWWFWVLVIPIEALAAGHVLNAWFPQVDSWIFALASVLLLAGTNLFSVAKYGEFEFWFAILKVTAILGFIGLGFAALMGWLPNREVSGLSGLMADYGGFAPNGWPAVVGAFITVMFSFIGTEAVTIAASESSDPSRNIAKATRSVIWRISTFYILSIFVIISVVPWNDPQLAVVGSYQRALEIMNIPNAALMVDLVVLVAVTSCMNSSIYIASRMMYSLAKRGDAPAPEQDLQGWCAACGGVWQHPDRGRHRHPQLLCAQGCVRVPAGQLWRHCLAGVHGHCHLAAAHAPPPGAGEHRAEVPHVAVPVPDLGGDHFHWWGAGGHDVHA